MRQAAAALALGMLLASPLLASADCGAEPPAQLPDLRALGIDFSFFGQSVELVEAGARDMAPLTVNVFVRNVGPGKSTGANLSVFQDGRPLAIVPVGVALNATGHENQTWAIYMWNISGVAPGRHVLRADVMDPAGDLNASDNSVERDLLFLDRSPVFDMSLSPGTLRANVTSSLPATVEFTGEVRTEMIDGLEPSVELEAKTSTGWATNIEYGPDFNGSEKVKAFKLRVIVPEGTHSDMGGTVIVNGHLTIGGLAYMGQCHGWVNVSAYFCASVECERPHQAIGPGDHEVFEYRIYNRGNALDNYTVKIANREELERKGWTLELSLATGRVHPGGFGRVNVQAVPPKDWSVYKDETSVIELNVTSNNNTQNPVIYSEQLPATVRVRGYNMPGVYLFSTALGLLVACGLAALYVWRRRRR